MVAVVVGSRAGTDSALRMALCGLHSDRWNSGESSMSDNLPDVAETIGELHMWADRESEELGDEAYSVVTLREAASLLESLPARVTQAETTGWYEFIMPGGSTTHIGYAYEDGSVYLPEGPDVVTEEDFRLASATKRFWKLERVEPLSPGTGNEASE